MLGRSRGRPVAAAAGRPLVGGLVVGLTPSAGTPLLFLLPTRPPEASDRIDRAGLERPLRLNRGSSPIPALSSLLPCQSLIDRLWFVLARSPGLQGNGESSRRSCAGPLFGPWSVCLPIDRLLTRSF